MSIVDAVIQIELRRSCDYIASRLSRCCKAVGRMSTGNSDPPLYGSYRVNTATLSSVIQIELRHSWLHCWQLVTLLPISHPDFN